MIVINYTEGDRARWDQFVARSKNGTFLFFRDYMDHHAERFPDASLMALDDNGAVQAVLPATRNGDKFSSHAGLTYGGFVTDERMTAGTMLDLFEASLEQLRQNAIRTLVYKSVPHIYHRSPAEEDLYALFRHGAELYRRDLLSVIDYRVEVKQTNRRRRGIMKAVREGIELREDDEYRSFWPVLASNLELRFGVQPAHTLDEIELLARRFPERIQLFTAYRGDTLVAGVVLYVSDHVCHVQYNASSPDGRKLGAIDLLFGHIIDSFAQRLRYFDFGISTDRDGRFLNRGLVQYKQEFGARAVTHDFYRLRV